MQFFHVYGCEILFMYILFSLTTKPEDINV